jgi:hypothetical protein
MRIAVLLVIFFFIGCATRRSISPEITAIANALEERVSERKAREYFLKQEDIDPQNLRALAATEPKSGHFMPRLMRCRSW